MLQKDIMTSVAKALGRARCKPHPCPWWEDEDNKQPHHIADRIFDREMSSAVLVDYTKCVSGTKFKKSNTYEDRILRLEEEMLSLEEEKLVQAKEIGDFSKALYISYLGIPESDIVPEVLDAVRKARRVFD